MKTYTNGGLTLCLLQTKSVHASIKQMLAQVRLVAKKRYTERVRSKHDLNLAAIEAVQYILDEMHNDEGGQNE